MCLAGPSAAACALLLTGIARFRSGFGSGREGGGAADRKRRFEDVDAASPSKRGAHRGEDTPPCQFKMVVSNRDAGTIIGRAGGTISGLQSKTGSRIRVSNSNEYFPGTQERAVLILGTQEAVIEGCTAILNELFRDSDSFKQAVSKEEADKLVLNHKLLVPEISCGQVIGKGGENINKMVADSGAKIQLTPKEKQANCGERILTVIGTLEQVVTATRLIIVKIWEDPKCRYDNLSTTYNQGPPDRGGPYGGDSGRGGGGWLRGEDDRYGPSRDGRGPPGHSGGGRFDRFDGYSGRGDATGGNGGFDSWSGRGGGGGGGMGDMYASVYPKMSGPNDPYANAYPRGGGRSNDRGGTGGGGVDPYANVYGGGGGMGGGGGSRGEPFHGDFDRGWGGGPTGGGGGGWGAPPTMGGWGPPPGNAAAPGYGAPPPSRENGAGWGGVPGSGYGQPVDGGNGQGGGGGWGGGGTSGGGWGGGGGGGDGGGGQQERGGGEVQYTLHVSDAVVPGILGRGGNVIKEIQEISGARIKVSQKGDYVPGTSLRIITISGNQVRIDSRCLSTADLVLLRIADTRCRHARAHAVSFSVSLAFQAVPQCVEHIRDGARQRRLGQTDSSLGSCCQRTRILMHLELLHTQEAASYAHQLVSAKIPQE